jgi:exopolyphosphatase/guanosine-5'-triphosphate,3'-diphosphate pyrophosphatase
LLFRLLALSPNEREVLPGMEEGRGDLIVPGLHIVLELMARLGKECLTVSDFGLLEGVVLMMDEGTPWPVAAIDNFELFQYIQSRFAP